MGSFHHNLCELSKHISLDTLDNLKYLCQDVISEAVRDGITTPWDLFQALQNCGKISVHNTDYLVELLEAEGRSDLVKILVYGSVNNITEETRSSYVGEQPVYGSQYDHSGN